MSVSATTAAAATAAAGGKEKESSSDAPTSGGKEAAAIDEIDENKDMVQSAEIVGSKKARGNATEKIHIDYIVHVVTSIPGVHWNIKRRYNQFADLHTALKKVVTTEKLLPTLPPKMYGLASPTSPESIEKRKLDLNVYLGALIKNQLVIKSDPFGAFLVGNFVDTLGLLKTYAQEKIALTKSLATAEEQRLATEQQRLKAVAYFESELKREKDRADRFEADLLKTKAELDALRKENEARLAANAQLQVIYQSTTKSTNETKKKNSLTLPIAHCVVCLCWYLG